MNNRIFNLLNPIYIKLLLKKITLNKNSTQISKIYNKVNNNKQMVETFNNIKMICNQYFQIFIQNFQNMNITNINMSLEESRLDQTFGL